MAKSELFFNGDFKKFHRSYFFIQDSNICFERSQRLYDFKKNIYNVLWPSAASGQSFKICRTAKKSLFPQKFLGVGLKQFT